MEALLSDDNLTEVIDNATTSPHIYAWDRIDLFPLRAIVIERVAVRLLNLCLPIGWARVAADLREVCVGDGRIEHSRDRRATRPPCIRRVSVRIVVDVT